MVIYTDDNEQLCVAHHSEQQYSVTIFGTDPKR